MLILTRRTTDWCDAARCYKVIIDGVEYGKIGNGERKEYILEEGAHTLQLKIDWCSSPKLSFFVQKGKTVYAECAPAKKPFLIGEILYITFLCRQYIYLNILGS